MFTMYEERFYFQTRPHFALKVNTLNCFGEKKKTLLYLHGGRKYVKAFFFQKKIL